jgi:microcystin-dependent protein
MATEPFLGEIRLFSFTFAPKGWAMCNGQLLPINQNQALFSILGTTYGGDGRQTFALPNLQGRVAIHQGNGIVEGQVGGSQSVTLASNQINHTHPMAANATPNSFVAAGNFPASAPNGSALYGPTANTSMNPAILSPVGGSQPHNNLQPYLVVVYCIAIFGIFPSRN